MRNTRTFFQQPILGGCLGLFILPSGAVVFSSCARNVARVKFVLFNHGEAVLSHSRLCTRVCGVRCSRFCPVLSTVTVALRNMPLCASALSSRHIWNSPFIRCSKALRTHPSFADVFVSLGLLRPNRPPLQCQKGVQLASLCLPMQHRCCTCSLGFSRLASWPHRILVCCPPSMQSFLNLQ